ncbi:uncharacterized protein BKA55DRAFT_58334 [Fusarium redolens]|uniref:Uncharacterized protein n=1 Tax=Fusarium redolens TaxID=48865 RepID=A0A9P9KY61_FUSRE|nr:uncharacterized protein BKA55DRAFT_58334 [Fusarium redolens]KAH7270706.1 hypothetical protein BKA55DRAFT_58334 [Fusarium redolens]
MAELPSTRHLYTLTNADTTLVKLQYNSTALVQLELHSQYMLRLLEWMCSQQRPSRPMTSRGALLKVHEETLLDLLRTSRY